MKQMFSRIIKHIFADSGKNIAWGRSLKVRLSLIVLLGLGLFIPSPLVHARNSAGTPQFNTNVTTANWQIFCGMFNIIPDTTQHVPIYYNSTGGYTGPSQTTSNHCSGIFLWTTTLASSGGSFYQDYHAPQNKAFNACNIAVYIPNIDAGAPNARYDESALADNGNPVWLAWPGMGFNQNQINSSQQGWLMIASNLDMKGYKAVRLTLSFHDTAGWDLAASAVAFSCTYH